MLVLVCPSVGSSIGSDRYTVFGLVQGKSEPENYALATKPVPVRALGIR